MRICQIYSLPDRVVRELSDAKNGLIKAKGRVECVGLHHSHQPIHPHGNDKGRVLVPRLCDTREQASKSSIVRKAWLNTVVVALSYSEQSLKAIVC